VEVWDHEASLTPTFSFEVPATNHKMSSEVFFLFDSQFESRYINFKDNLLKESDTDGIFLRIEIIILYMNLEE
jgi:hypothetical protein